MRAPRVNDKRIDEETGSVRFASAILPAWARKSPQVAEVLPLLYLHGMSSGDFVPALEQFLGSAAGLSASTITRLTAQWQDDAEAFNKRSLKDTDYVYCWVDGIHLKVRLDDKVCLLVILGVRADGTKELVALADGFRESSESWADLLRSCKRRGMRAPVLAVGDGALGFWKAIREVFPDTKEQRCWWHKMANVLAACPSPLSPGARAALAEIYNAEDREHALKAKAFEPSTAPSGPRPSPRSPGTSTCCSRSTTTPPSTGSTCGPRTRSSRRSPPCGCGSESPRAPAPGPPASRWRSSSSSPHKPGGVPSPRPTSSPLSEPAPCSKTAHSSNDPTNQDVISKSRDTPIHRS